MRPNRPSGFPVVTEWDSLPRPAVAPRVVAVSATLSHVRTRRTGAAAGRPRKPDRSPKVKLYPAWRDAGGRAGRQSDRGRADDFPRGLARQTLGGQPYTRTPALVQRESLHDTGWLAPHGTRSGNGEASAKDRPAATPAPTVRPGKPFRRGYVRWRRRRFMRLHMLRVPVDNREAVFYGLTVECRDRPVRVPNRKEETPWALTDR